MRGFPSERPTIVTAVTNVIFPVLLRRYLVSLSDSQQTHDQSGGKPESKTQVGHGLKNGRLPAIAQAVYCVRALLILGVFTLAGCNSPAGQGSRLLPWNWFHADANKRLEKAEAKTEHLEHEAVHTAHVETVKAGLALAVAGDSKPVEIARRTVGNAKGLLAQVSPLTAAEDAEARSIVDDFLSGQVERVAAAERAQAAAEKQNGQLSRDLAAASEALKVAEGKLAQANLENATAAAKYRRLWFWIYTIAGSWVALQILAGISRFYPALAPVARVAGLVSAPVVQAAYERTTSAVARAIVDAEKISTQTADTLRYYLDPRADEAEQAVIKTKVQKANA